LGIVAAAGGNKVLEARGDALLIHGILANHHDPLIGAFHIEMPEIDN